MTVVAYDYGSPEVLGGWAQEAMSLPPSAPVIRLVAETSEEERRAYALARSAEVWAETVGLVRAALQSGAPYGEASQARHAAYRQLRMEQRGLQDVGLRPSIRTAIQSHLGRAWVETMERGESFLEAAGKVWTEQRLRSGPRTRDAEREAALVTEAEEELDRFGFAFLAVQIAANEEIPLSGEDALVDDLMHPPRTVYLCSCELAVLRGGEPFRWLEHVYAQDEHGAAREALGLLMEGTMRCPARRLPSLLQQIKLSRLGTVCLQGVITLASGVSGPEVRRVRMDAEAHLERRYRG